MIKTTNYDLIVVEGKDKVNLLTQMNPNTEKIDEVMKNNENSGVQIATELLSGTVHAITRTVKSASMFKFTAVSNYTSGDTFTVDGVQVTALLTSGEALGTGAYIIGSEVLCSLKDTLLTVYTQGGTVKIAEDAEKLGGNLPEYYAKQSDLDIVKNTADNASSLSRTNSENINKININLTDLNEVILKAPDEINYIYNFTSETSKAFEYECKKTGNYVISAGGSDFFSHYFITDKQYGKEIVGMWNNSVATKLKCTNQFKMYKGHKYNIEVYNVTFQMYEY